MWVIMFEKSLKHIIKYILVFALTAALCAALLVSSALIPKEAVRENTLRSAGFFAENGIFCDRITGSAATRIDNYADTITVSIGWCFDENDPLGSTMRAEYYNNDYENVRDSFAKGLQDSGYARTEYLRYWHGSSAVSRIMHAFTDISGMHACAAVLIFTLAAVLLAVLIRFRLYAEAVCSALALISVSIWFVPDSIQNVWCFIIMLAAAPLCVLSAMKGRYESVCTVLLISGVVTNFFDFLTVETLTLLFPLILVISIKRRKGGSLKDDLIYAAKCCALWLGGYCLMWVLKWICAAVILNIDVLPYIGGHISERMYDRGDIGLAAYLIEMLARNIGCLFPFGYTEPGVIAAVLLTLVFCFYVFVFRKKGWDKRTVLIFMLLGAVVFIRYFVLHNHSYGHYFFTYRAQASVMLAVLLSAAEITGARVRHGKKT